MTAARLHKGIPESITISAVKKWIRPRVSEKRLRHIAGTADVAKLIACQVGCDTFLAELAAWLHDTCKEIKDRELVAMADEFGLTLHPIEREYGHLLHGPVAAKFVRKELGITNQDVLDAIHQHTLGFVPMTVFSKAIFLADCLEASRPREYTYPIWSALDLGKTNDLDKAMVVASDLGIKLLIDSGKPIHPLSIEVRNHHLQIVRRRSH